MPLIIRATILLGVCALLAGCSLTDDEPLAPGTFEISVSGDIDAEATGTASVAAPDSSRNGISGPWVVRIPFSFGSELDAGDEAEVRFEVYEPREPNGPFTKLPDGTLLVDKLARDPSVPLVACVVRTENIDFQPTDGTLRLRRTADGIEGDLDARYVEVQFSGEVFEGRVRLRFHVLTADVPRPGLTASTVSLD